MYARSTNFSRHLKTVTIKREGYANAKTH